MIAYDDRGVTVYQGDCLDVLRTLPDASVDAVVTDPPYGLGFMGKEWDSGKSFVERKAAKGNTFDHVGGNHNPSSSADASRTRGVEARKFGAWCEFWTAECLRVLKPGGHLLAFGGTRTWHRLACAVEDAGFEVRDSIAWLYGSGFPKSLNLVDASGERTGWGTALKPAHEPIVVARKPLVGTVAANVLLHGTGALNVDGCRVEHASAADLAESAGKNRHADFGSGPRENKVYGADLRDRGEGGNYDGSKGRWPANVVLDESQAEALDEQSGTCRSAGQYVRGAVGLGDKAGPASIPIDGLTSATYDDLGGASRFFYVAKADASERVRVNGTAHPTVKPLALMRWLVRLVTPPGGTVLEPFAGSGTTVEACILEGFRCIAIEREADYLPLIVQRIHRRRDPVEAVRGSGADGGLFDLLDGGAA